MRDSPWVQWLRRQPEWRCIFGGRTYELDCCHMAHGASRLTAGEEAEHCFPCIHDIHMKWHTEGARFWTPYRLRCLWEWAEGMPALRERFRACMAEVGRGNV